MAVKNEWRSKGFGDSQQVPMFPISGEHIFCVALTNLNGNGFRFFGRVELVTVQFSWATIDLWLIQ